MKSVLISIQPKWCDMIADGKKTIEVRKTRPKLETPFKVYIYCTKDKPTFTQSAFCEDISNGKVIGEFICRGMMQPFTSLSLMEKESCLTEQELLEYSKGKTLFGWRIADLVIYEKPRELSEFSKYGFGRVVPLKRPPQSWCYVEVRE